MNTKNYIPRVVENYIFDDSLIGLHMVFLAGPRQVGKTTLAKQWLKKKSCEHLYYNWDDVSTRHAYLKDSRFFESPARSPGLPNPWIVFDEIHKQRLWKDILKGAFDIFGDEFRFCITGSARLDLFRRSGDALIGRYSLFHMMPLSINEIMGKNLVPDVFISENVNSMADKFAEAVSQPQMSEVTDIYDSLMRFGPFPEPFLRQNDRFSRKWHQDYLSLLVRQDLRDISRVVELDKIEHLVLLLPHRIMAPLSMANLSNELEVAHTSVKKWLEELKRLYLVYPVAPWFKKISRGLKKEKKWYFLDWFFAPQGPARLENMVASCLYRMCLALSDMGYGDFCLHYIRTLDKKEIDFVLVKDNRPFLAVEVKLGETSLSGTLRDRKKWFHDQNTIGVQVVDKRNVLQKFPDHTWIMSVERFLATLI